MNAREAKRPHAAAPLRMPWCAALRQAVMPRAQCRAMAAAFVVGTTLLSVDVVAQGHDAHLTPIATLRIVLTYLVPWGNATFGIALGLRDHDD
ncbi:Uncharacterised protein [Mycobacterium tuberculosis]|nr:Uncharacterised protein [Mycobacterium tuberculosis]